MISILQPFCRFFPFLFSPFFPFFFFFFGRWTERVVGLLDAMLAKPEGVSENDLTEARETVKILKAVRVRHNMLHLMGHKVR